MKAAFEALDKDGDGSIAAGQESKEEKDQTKKQKKKQKKKERVGVCGGDIQTKDRRRANINNKSHQQITSNQLRPAREECFQGGAARGQRTQALVRYIGRKIDHHCAQQHIHDMIVMNMIVP